MLFYILSCVMNLNINILVLLNFNVCMNWTRTSYVTNYFWNMQLHLGACLYVYAHRQWSPYKLGSLAAFSVSYVWPILFWREMDLQLMCKPSKRKCFAYSVKDDCSDFKKVSVCFTVVLVFLHCMLCTSLRIAANYSWFHEFVLLFLCTEHLYKDDVYCGALHSHTGLKRILMWHRV